MRSDSVVSVGLAFDDVLLVPGYADFIRDDVDLSAQLTRNISLKLPLVAAPMDTVTGHELAIALARQGGIGILHRNSRIKDQATEVAKVKAEGLLVGAAAGVGEGFQERIAALVEAKVDVVCLDSAHGYTNHMVEAIKWVKQTYPRLDIIAGNVATYNGAKALAEAGADGIRVGMGPGAICTTRIISGMGVPQFTAVTETVRACKELDVPVIADGGIKYSGDMVKALAAGASTVMMGSYFGAASEAPGEVVELHPEQVPARFKSIFKPDTVSYKFKQYRGMGSVGAMQDGAKINGEDEFHGKSFKDKVLVAEGVESLIPIKGTVQQLTDQAVGGLRSGMFYVGARDIKSLQDKAEFMQITQASLNESHPHDVVITNPGDNY